MIDFQAFDDIAALVVVLDAQDRVVYWNRACSDLTGYSFEEASGRALWDFLLSPSEVGQVKAAFTQLRATNHPRQITHHWLGKGGETRWIAWSIMSTRDTAGGMHYIIKTGVDQTDSKRLQDALRSSESRLAGLIELAADAIISIDSDQRIVIYNQGAERIFGWSALEAVGEPFSMLLPERFRERHAQLVGVFGRSNVSSRRMAERIPEVFGLRKNGEEFPAQASISKTEVDGGWLFTAILKDVHKQKWQQAAQQLLAALGTALVATLDHDQMLSSIAQVAVQDFADCCVIGLVTNAGNIRQLAATHREPGKRALCERLQRVDRWHPHLISSVFESNQPTLLVQVSPWDLELLARSDQQLRALQELAPRSLMAVPLYARAQKVGVAMFFSSSRLYGPEDFALAEEFACRVALGLENARLYADARCHGDDLREANQQLVSATIRAQELAQEAEAAQQRAEASERELTEVAKFREMFLGVVGHDLRTPLNGISMVASLLLERGELEETDKMAVGRIEHSVGRMRRMISQLLDVTRTRLGTGIPLEPKATDLAGVCRRVAQEFPTPIQLQVGTNIAGNWDADRLEQALSNIVGNAVEHAAPGTVVAVKAHVAAEWAAIEIVNQGSPIPSTLLPFIFEPFRRDAQSEGPRAGHLGLGLYIANQIALAHGGTLEVHPSSGTTCFIMRLPLGRRVQQSGEWSLPSADLERVRAGRKTAG